MRLWYPNRVQWWVIWVSVLLALFIWNVNATRSNEVERGVLSILVIGALLVWRFANRS
jgi:hypothetical protein